MAKKKIVDEGEVIRWFEEGRTHQWMVDEYRRKYDIEMGQSAFGNFRRRRGLDRRIHRDDELIPWLVEREHRWDYAIMMLRTVARVRAGFEVPDARRHNAEVWERHLRERGDVVDYDAAIGFTYVQRRPNIDHDLVRVPDRYTARRRAD